MRTFDVGVPLDDRFWQELQVKGLVTGTVHDEDARLTYEVEFFTPLTCSDAADASN